LLLFVTFFTICNFCNLLFTVERGKVCYFFTAYNFHKLFFTIEKGHGLYSIHCATRERVQLDFFFSFFLLLRGRGVEVNVFFSPFIGNVEGGGGKGVNFFLEMFFSLWKG